MDILYYCISTLNHRELAISIINFKVDEDHDIDFDCSFSSSPRIRGHPSCHSHRVSGLIARIGNFTGKLTIRGAIPP